ncbi:hypothetical protein T12_3639 [Trichinella patagoniensis]|uniref:Uncharacterized protein n=1 Tax=Trichinella patagoniensis TaxID=990121 RepID=A0A0V0YRD8_9BILA|nr:hypothetical protein T12_3639 [Trichinella patagoniensis]
MEFFNGLIILIKIEVFIPSVDVFFFRMLVLIICLNIFRGRGIKSPYSVLAAS